MSTTNTLDTAPARPVPVNTVSAARAEAVTLRLERCAVAGAFCASAITIADLLFFAQQPTAMALMLCFSLAIPLGLLLGCIISVVLAVMDRLPSVVRAALPWGCGTVTSVWLVMALGVPAKLFGPRASIAVIGLTAAIIAGATMTLLVVMVRSATSAGARLSTLSPSRRWAVGLAMFATAGLLTWCDRNVLPDLYSPAHRAMRSMAIGFVLAASLLPPWFTSVAQGRGYGAAVRVRSVLVCLALLCAALAVALPCDTEEYRVLNSQQYPRRLLGAARTLLDVDFDGYASALGGGDCAPWNPLVHPFAREVPENAIDEDCSGRDATATARTTPRPAARIDAAALGRPNIVLITVDTLRADRTLAGGPMPTLTRWSANATVFERTYSPVPATMLALSSAFCGRYPRHLPWAIRFATSAGRIVPARDLQRLRSDERVLYSVFALPDDGCRRLPEQLRDHGYFTTAVVAGDAPFLSHEEFSPFGQFDRYVPVARNSRSADDAATTALAVQVLAELPADRPSFVWLHYFGPHAPSEPQPSVGPFPTGVIPRYDHEVAFTDRSLGPLFDALEELQNQRPTVAVLTSDHGEAFAGATRGHGSTVREDDLRVPLIIRAPTYPAARVTTPVSLVDLTPTLLSLAGANVPEQLDGMDLGALVSGPRGAPWPERVVISEAWASDAAGETSFRQMAAIRGAHKVMLDTKLLDEAAYRVVGSHEKLSRWERDHFALRARLREFVDDHPPDVVRR